MATSKSTKTEDSVKKTEGPLSYVGPNIPKLGLTQYQVYIGGVPVFPDIVQEEQKIRLSRLIVSVSKLSDVMSTIETRGTVYNKFYNDGLSVRRELN